MNLKLFKKHDIGPRHITKLVPVSRLTASGWLNGHHSPNKYMLERMQAISDAIETAEQYAELPPPEAFKGRARDQYIVVILKKYTEGPGKKLVRRE